MEETRKDVPEKGKKEKSVLNYYVKLVFLFALLALVFWFGFEKGKKSDENKSPVVENLLDLKGLKESEKIDLTLYWNVFSKLKEKYVDAEKLTNEDLLYSSIRGMLSATDDPYTVFMDPEENKAFDEDIEGTFEGIGAELGIKQGILTVVSPLKDSPAEKAGLRVGDKILKVNDESTADMSIDDAVSKIRG
ncbi:MAG: PDZ domain-containing protein, partial [Candidatus Moraniibacteriota bacterium]